MSFRNSIAAQQNNKHEQLNATPAGVYSLKMSGFATERQSQPSVARQKTFIVEHADILDEITMKTIQRIVMMAIGGKEIVIRDPDEKVVQTIPVVLESGTTHEISINLDNIDNPDIILQIYNIVYNRRAALNEPAHSGKH